MRIRMKTGMAGTAADTGVPFCWQPGQEVDVHNNEAMRLIAAGAAEPVHPDGKAEQKWELRISPADYLSRFPNGPNRALALELTQ